MGGMVTRRVSQPLRDGAGTVGESTVRRNVAQVRRRQELEELSRPVDRCSRLITRRLPDLAAGVVR